MFLGVATRVWPLDPWTNPRQILSGFHAHRSKGSTKTTTATTAITGMTAFRPLPFQPCHLKVAPPDPTFPPRVWREDLYALHWSARVNVGVISLIILQFPRLVAPPSFIWRSNACPTTRLQWTLLSQTAVQEVLQFAFVSLSFAGCTPDLQVSPALSKHGWSELWVFWNCMRCWLPCRPGESFSLLQCSAHKCSKILYFLRSQAHKQFRNCQGKHFCTVANYSGTQIGYFWSSHNSSKTNSN